MRAHVSFPELLCVSVLAVLAALHSSRPARADASGSGSGSNGSGRFKVDRKSDKKGRTTKFVFDEARCTAPAAAAGLLCAPTLQIRMSVKCGSSTTIMFKEFAASDVSGQGQEFTMDEVEQRWQDDHGTKPPWTQDKAGDITSHCSIEYGLRCELQCVDPTDPNAEAREFTFETTAEELGEEF